MPFDILSLVNGWESLVQTCEEGYPLGIYEYNNDIKIRGQIQEMLLRQVADANLSQGISQRIEEIDSRLMSLFQPGVVKPYASGEWWARGVLKYANDEYREDIKRKYGIDVELVPEIE